MKRLGDTPIIIEFASDDANIEIAARPEHRALLTGLGGSDQTRSCSNCRP